MCLGAIYWARPEIIYYANSRKDASEIGFDDSFIYDEINTDLNMRKIPILNIGREEAGNVFKKWKEKKDKKIY
jgi:tRNA(Arg) A34 adenosine deaminase TadA